MSLHDNSLAAVFTDTLMELMKDNLNIVCLDSDLGRATGAYIKIRDAFPDNYFNVGVAEANMIGIASGLANEGKIPFAASFSCFVTRRVYDQATISVAYANNPVQIIGFDPGVAVTMNGGTHMCFEDMAIMRAMPNMRVFSPVDVYELKTLIKYMVADPKPTYTRFIRGKMPDVFDEDYVFDPNKAKVIDEGSDVTLVTTGLATKIAIDASAELKNAGVSVDHLHYPSVKPFDSETLIASAKRTNAVVTVENHNVIGGLGGAVCEVLADSYPSKVKRLGAQDRFGEVGTLDFLIDTIGIDVHHITVACREMKERRTIDS